MSYYMRLQNLPQEANSKDIRMFFKEFVIPKGGVHIIGGRYDEAKITFATEFDLLRAMQMDQKPMLGQSVTLLLAREGEDADPLKAAGYTEQSYVNKDEVHTKPAQHPERSYFSGSPDSAHDYHKPDRHSEGRGLKDKQKDEAQKKLSRLPVKFAISKKDGDQKSLAEAQQEFNMLGKSTEDWYKRQLGIITKDSSSSGSDNEAPMTSEKALATPQESTGPRLSALDILGFFGSKQPPETSEVDDGSRKHKNSGRKARSQTSSHSPSPRERHYGRSSSSSSSSSRSPSPQVRDWRSNSYKRDKPRSRSRSRSLDRGRHRSHKRSHRRDRSRSSDRNRGSLDQDSRPIRHGGRNVFDSAGRERGSKRRRSRSRDRSRGRERSRSKDRISDWKRKPTESEIESTRKVKLKPAERMRGDVIDSSNIQQEGSSSKSMSDWKQKSPGHVIVKNLDYSITYQHIMDYYSGYAIQEYGVTLKYDDKMPNTVIGGVVFVTREVAEKAVKYKGKLNGKEVKTTLVDQATYAQQLAEKADFIPITGAFSDESSQSFSQASPAPVPGPGPYPPAFPPQSGQLIRMRPSHPRMIRPGPYMGPMRSGPPIGPGGRLIGPPIGPPIGPRGPSFGPGGRHIRPDGPPIGPDGHPMRPRGPLIRPGGPPVRPGARGPPPMGISPHPGVPPAFVRGRPVMIVGPPMHPGPPRGFGIMGPSFRPRPSHVTVTPPIVRAHMVQSAPVSKSRPSTGIAIIGKSKLHNYNKKYDNYIRIAGLKSDATACDLFEQLSRICIRNRANATTVTPLGVTLLVSGQGVPQCAFAAYIADQERYKSLMFEIQRVKSYVCHHVSEADKLLALHCRNKDTKVFYSNSPDSEGELAESHMDDLVQNYLRLSKEVKRGAQMRAISMDGATAEAEAKASIDDDKNEKTKSPNDTKEPNSQA